MTFDSENRVAKWNNQTAALTVVHDVDGNMTSGPLPPLLPGPGQQSPGLGAFGYDSRNRLLSCNGVSYTYDAENLRTKVTTTAGVTNWVLNSAGAPAQPLVRTAPGGAITRYVWGLGLLYEVADGDTQPKRTYHYDRRGSTVALSNADGRTITDRWAYGPYGERLSHSGTSDTPFQFNGFFGVQTDTNGLLYMNARYYNVETRRFTAADPAGFGASANFYWFANADPFSLADPFGLGAQDTSGGSVSWKNPDGSVKWGTYLWEALAGVPDYLKNNGASSFKRNITDPKFVLENRSGGLGMAAAVERGSAIASERAAAEGTLQTTVHGAERIAGATATRGGVLSEAGVAAVRQRGRVMTQADGAKVRILEA